MEAQADFATRCLENAMARGVPNQFSHRSSEKWPEPKRESKRKAKHRWARSDFMTKEKLMKEVAHVVKEIMMPMMDDFKHA